MVTFESGVILMKDIFSYNSDIDKNAYINWRTERFNPIHNMMTLADGFMDASIMLAEQCLKDNRDKKADIIIYSILFNANHSIELYLKAIMWILNRIIGNDKRVEGKHNIKQILNVVQSRVNEFEIDKDRKKQFIKLTNNLKAYIDELFAKPEKEVKGKEKDNMDFSRYPFDKTYESHFYIDTFDNVVVDLENFIERFKEIRQNLRQIAMHYLYDILDADHD